MKILGFLFSFILRFNGAIYTAYYSKTIKTEGV